MRRRGDRAAAGGTTTEVHRASVQEMLRESTVLSVAETVAAAATELSASAGSLSESAGAAVREAGSARGTIEVLESSSVAAKTSVVMTSIGSTIGEMDLMVDGISVAVDGRAHDDSSSANGLSQLAEVLRTEVLHFLTVMRAG